MIIFLVFDYRFLERRSFLEESNSSEISGCNAQEGLGIWKNLSRLSEVLGISLAEVGRKFSDILDIDIK